MAIDKALHENRVFSENFAYSELDAPPLRKLVIITCMDARIQVEKALGLNSGEAHILRNAGATVTDDMLRSVIVSTNALGTRQIMIINHTKCGMLGCNDQDLQKQLVEQYGPADDAPDAFHSFTDLTAHMKTQVGKLRNHPWLPADTVIRGFTYDVETGLLHEVDCT